MTEEQIQEIISAFEPETLDQEPVYGGFRVLTKRYIHDTGVLIETLSYQHPATSDAWAAVANVEYSDGDPNDLPVFRSWNISNGNGVFRRVDLVSMSIDAPRISILFLVRHFTDESRSLPAPFASKIVKRVADNVLLVDVDVSLQAQGAPAQMGERAYWDLLTSVGYTPYQLLDQRVPELDNLNAFN